MITFTQGNLLEAPVDALVNTVNTVGVMGKGIALMFKERFSRNYDLYADACKAKQVRTGKMFVTEVFELNGPRWIVNFPTKQHWKAKSRLEWIVDGLQDLRQFLVEHQVKSIAIPALGAGNGGLEWVAVRAEIEKALGDLDVEILIFEPTTKYQNVAKREGVEKLTPARALIAEMVRRYWVLGMECSLLEIQKLAWFLERAIEQFSADKNPLKLQFVAHSEEGQPLRVSFPHFLQGICGDFHRLIPGNLGIFAGTARPHPLQRGLQARGAILRHDAGAALAAEHALIHRMIGIAFNIAHPAILQMHANPTTAGAHIAGGCLHLIADRRRIGDPIRCAAVWHTPILHFSGEE